MPKRPRRRLPNEPAASGGAANAAAVAPEASGDSAAAQRTAHLKDSLTHALLDDAGGARYSARFALQVLEDTRPAADVQSMAQVRLLALHDACCIARTAALNASVLLPIWQCCWQCIACTRL